MKANLNDDLLREIVLTQLTEGDAEFNTNSDIAVALTELSFDCSTPDPLTHNLGEGLVAAGLVVGGPSRRRCCRPPFSSGQSTEHLTAVGLRSPAMGIAEGCGVEIYFEVFGEVGDPALILVNGLGSHCTNFAGGWCEKFAAQGFRVVRMDNRDTGLSGRVEGGEYSLGDMAGDVVGVFDALGVERAHVMGLSLGGMIVQRLAIEHPERLLSLTSVMSTTGEPEYGKPTKEALAVLLSPAAGEREAFLEQYVASNRVIGSKPEWRDEAYVRGLAAQQWDRGYDSAGVARQVHAALSDGSRADALREVTVPTLVLHGSRDPLITPSGGRRTAELIPNARYVEIDGLGHDYPPAVWDLWVDTWAGFVADI